MAQRAKRPAEAWWYTLKKDEGLPKEEQSRFLLRPLTQAERMRVWDDYTVVSKDANGERVVADRSFQQAYGLALTNIADVENFPAGEAAPWPSKKPARMEYLNTMDDMDVWELGNEIREHSALEKPVTEKPAKEGEKVDAEEDEHSVPNS